jgi:DNA-binding helix-hairpin-helix protein with protein kinase domain
MQLRRHTTQELLNFASAATLGVGGEARVFIVSGRTGLAAKIYHKPTPQHAAKLAAMLANPPDDPMAGTGHVSIAWPQDLLLSPYDGQRVLGFLMPLVSDVHPIIDFYNPASRRRQHPLFNYVYLLRTARNLAAAIRALHVRGYVIGDVNESNILVSETALVTLVDTDSFQVPDARRGSIYRCPVGKPEFTPPELQGRNFATVDRRPEHDQFGLAVLIFQLLMEGTHPFAGRYTSAGEPPLLEERIAAGHFPYGLRRHAPYQPMPLAPGFEILPPALAELFVRCFADGHHKPANRPDAPTWLKALQQAEDCLLTCRANDQHCYANHLRVCPWCERRDRLRGHDPFPTRQSVQQGQHLRPATAAHPTAPPVLQPVPRSPAQPVPPRPARRFQSPRIRWAVVLTTLLTLTAAAGWYFSVHLPAQHRQAEAWAKVQSERLAKEKADAEARAKAMIARLETAVTGRDKFGAEDVLAELEALIPSDARMAALRKKVAAIPGPKKKLTVDLGGTVTMELVLIRPGTFQMGEKQSAHKVTLTKAFYLGKCLVTQEQWERVMGSNPSNFKRAKNPVETVSWDDCQTFIRKLGEKVPGQTFRLPTEAEWEYACRAGSTGEYCYGDGEGGLGEYAWYDSNSGRTTHPVGEKKPNAWGLYDMHGNVWEWCADWYGDYPNGEVTNPTGPGSGQFRVLRGGSWRDNPGYCRSASRFRNSPVNRNYNFGVRLCLDFP